ncbi:xylosyltransferase I, putative, partial [Ixodes scapularis]
SQLGFEPACEITEKDALSAIRRATSLHCRRELANVTCLAQAGTLYPARLPRSCESASGVPTKKESVWPVVGAVPPPARIAFLLSVNGRAVRQVLRLLKTLYHERHVFYIHVDAVSQNSLLADIEISAAPCPVFSFYKFGSLCIVGSYWPSDVGYRPFQSVLSTVSLGCSVNVCRFPLWLFGRPRERLEEFLAANMGSNFVKSHGQDTQRFISKQALERTFHECGGRMWRLGPRQLPWGLRLDGGSDWVALHRDFCSYVALPERQDALLAGLRSLFGHTLLPAESFFHTALQNSAFCSSVVDNNLRLVNWKRRQGCQCQHRHVVDWCGCSPNVFRPDDWHRIRATRDRPVFFARKFEPVVSRRIVDQLERWISDPASEASTAAPVVADAGYWQSQYEPLDDDATLEDHQLTAYQSLTRLALSRAEFTCSQPPEGGLHVRGVSLYFYGDQFQGLLVSWGSLSATTEAFLSPRNHRRNGDADLPASVRLRLLQVGSQYDPKEQMLRDFPRLLGPRSEPGALHSWAAGRALAVTFVWVDPAKVVAGSYEVRVESGPQTLFHRPEFRKPLRPGAWTLLVFYEWRLVGQTRFLVLPVVPAAGGAEAAAEVNGGPRGPYIDHDLSRVEEHLGYSRETRAALKAQADADGRRTGRELERWVDALIAEFWTFQGACSIRGRDAAEGDRCDVGLPACGKTEWSSFSYD